MDLGPDAPIQQYVNPWGGPYYPPNPSNHGQAPLVEPSYAEPPFPEPPYAEPPIGGPPIGGPPFGGPPFGGPPFGGPPFGGPPFGGPPFGRPPFGKPFGGPPFGGPPFGKPFGPFGRPLGPPFVGPPPLGPPPFGPVGFAPVETEYGIFIPDGHHDPHDHHGFDVFAPPPPPPYGFPADLIDSLWDLVPRSVGFMFAKWSAFIVSIFSLVAFGGIMTTAICSFTSFCSITFASLPFAALRNSFASKKDENGNSSIDRVRRAVQFVTSAIEKYDKLQQSASSRKAKVAQN